MDLYRESYALRILEENKKRFGSLELKGKYI